MTHLVEIYDTPETPHKLADSGAMYTERTNLEALKSLDDVKLLEFGSLFGGSRLVLSRNNHRDLYRRTEGMMAFREPNLDAASEAIARRLGGRNSYFAVHLRVGIGHDKFQVRLRAPIAPPQLS